MPRHSPPWPWPQQWGRAGETQGQEGVDFEQVGHYPRDQLLWASPTTLPGPVTLESWARFSASGLRGSVNGPLGISPLTRYKILCGVFMRVSDERVHTQIRLGTLAVELWEQIGKGLAKGILGTARALLGPSNP